MKRTLKKASVVGGVTILAVGLIAIGGVWAAMMGCVIQTGDGEVCMAIAQAVVHKDTADSRAIVTKYLNTDWLGRPITSPKINGVPL